MHMLVPGDERGHWATAVSGEDTPFCHGDVAQTGKNLPAIQETRVRSLD